MRRLIVITAYVLLVSWSCRAAMPDTSYTMTGAIHPGFKTVQVHPADTDGNIRELPPVIELGGDDRIVVSFDELDDDRRYMRYELIHCDALWNPDGLVDSEFLDGFNQGDVTDFQYSGATLAHYVNYRIMIPNEQVSPKISGNYVLRVYPEDDPGQTLVQARFSVSESTAPIEIDFTTMTDVDYNEEHQQLSLKVDTERLDIIDPFNDLRVVVEQDSRTDNPVVVSHPLRLQARKAVFEHNRDLIFPAGNEYRRFEVINDHRLGMGVDDILYAEPLYHYVLATDKPRADHRYIYDLSRQGRYVVRCQNCSDSDTDADYVVVHFSLEMPELPGYNIYIEGDITDRRLNPESMMVYNPEEGAYQKSLLLKQGAYSYQYLALPADGSSAGSTSLVEGDYFPTRHTYTVRAYHRKPGERYDRLVGWRLLDTEKQNRRNR